MRIRVATVIAKKKKGTSKCERTHTSTHYGESYPLFFVFFAPLALASSNFNQMVGTYDELQACLKEYVEELSRSDERRNAL